MSRVLGEVVPFVEARPRIRQRARRRVRRILNTQRGGDRGTVPEERRPQKVVVKSPSVLGVSRRVNADEAAARAFFRASQIGY